MYSPNPFQIPLESLLLLLLLWKFFLSLFTIFSKNEGNLSFFFFFFFVFCLSKSRILSLQILCAFKLFFLFLFCELTFLYYYFLVILFDAHKLGILMYFIKSFMIEKKCLYDPVFRDYFRAIMRTFAEM